MFNIEIFNSKTFQFTRKSAKYFCFVVSIVIISIYLLATSIKTLDIIKKYSEESHNQTARTLVKEYSTIFDSLFYGIFGELQQLSKNASHLDSTNEEKMFNWLKINNDIRFKEFNDISFATFEGDTYISNGVKIYVGYDRVFRDFLNSDQKYRLVGPDKINSEVGEQITFLHKVYTPDNKIKGVLGASISLKELKEIIEKMDIENAGTFFVISNNGKFVCHALDRYLGKIANDFKDESLKYTSEYLANPDIEISEKNSLIDNSLVRVYTFPIRSVGWTCGVSIKKEKIFESYNFLQRIVITVICVTIFMIAFFSLVSILFFNKTVTTESYYDELTGLWTRYKFEIEAQKMLDAKPDGSFVLIDMDFRGFKFVNQGAGKQFADELLKTCAKVILEHCKSVNFICGHGYADRFFAMGEIVTVLRFMKVFDEFVSKINAATEFSPIPVYFKYGITYVLPGKEFYKNRRTIQELFGETTYAKDMVKQSVLKSYEFFSPAMQIKIERDQIIEQNMEKGLANHEFIVYYQPKISLTNDKVQGAEALVRWNSSEPKLGFLAPGDFIPLFERNGFIVQLDFEVYEQVFKYLRKELDAGNPVVPISVNMARNHNDPDKFVDEFIRRFNKYNLPADLIEVEILERAVENNIFNLISITQKLHEHGFTVAMDDFGSGQSSLNMLSEIPIDVIKFDQNFLRRQSINLEDDKMINILIDLGKKLNKRTLFEGVETKAQRDLLKSLKCDEVQGYFYSKPLTEQEFSDFIKNHI